MQLQPGTYRGHIIDCGLTQTPNGELKFTLVFGVNQYENDAGEYAYLDQLYERDVDLFVYDRDGQPNVNSMRDLDRAGFIGDDPMAMTPDDFSAEARDEAQGVKLRSDVDRKTGKYERWYIARSGGSRAYLPSNDVPRETARLIQSVWKRERSDAAPPPPPAARQQSAPPRAPAPASTPAPAPAPAQDAPRSAPPARQQAPKPGPDLETQFDGVQTEEDAWNRANDVYEAVRGTAKDGGMTQDWQAAVAEHKKRSGHKPDEFLDDDWRAVAILTTKYALDGIPF